MDSLKRLHGLDTLMTCVCHPRESLEEQMTELESCQWQASVQTNRFIFLSWVFLFKVLIFRRVLFLMHCAGHPLKSWIPFAGLGWGKVGNTELSLSLT